MIRQTLPKGFALARPHATASSKQTRADASIEAAIAMRSLLKLFMITFKALVFLAK